jgi:hypothetical protein
VLRQYSARKTLPGEFMTQSLVLGFPLPVAIAFGALLAVLAMLARLLVPLRKPAPLRQPERSYHFVFDPDPSPLPASAEAMVATETVDEFQ